MLGNGWIEECGGEMKVDKEKSYNKLLLAGK